MRKEPSRAEFEAFWADMRNKIKTFGYIVQGVGADEDTYAYCYTIGRTYEARADFFMFGGSNIFMALNDVVDKFKNHTIQDFIGMSDQDSIFEVPGFTVKINGVSQPLRARIAVAKKDLVTKLAVQATNPAVIDRKPLMYCQIFLADENNKVPGEEGFKSWDPRILDLTEKFPNDMSQGQQFFDNKAGLQVFSLRAECRYDLNLFEVKMVDADYKVYYPNRIDNGHGEELLEFRTDATQRQIEEVLARIPDSHVMFQTLRPVTAKENSFERDYDKGLHI